MTEEAYVLSDLHLGGGPLEPQLEDFAQDSAMATFVRSIARPGVTLFINGDFIDFPQIPPYKVPEPHDLLWNEATSLAKAQAAISAHAEVFEALTEFIAAGAVLCVHVGNHDLDLAWPTVQAHLHTHLKDRSGHGLRFSLTHSVYHGVHIEHGHRFTPENAPRDPGSFIHEWPAASGQYFLERVWGTDFMLRFYNRVEREYSFADNVKPALSILYHGIKNRWISAAEFVRLTRFLLDRGLPWSGAASALLGSQGPNGMRTLGGRRPDSTRILGAVKDPEWQSMLANRLTDPSFLGEMQQGIEELSDTEKVVLMTRDLDLGDLPGPLVGTEKQVATLGLFRENREVRAARKRLKDGASHVIFGHTHEVVDGAVDSTLFNPGTWLPRLNLGSNTVKARLKKNGLTLQMLNDPSLYVADRKVVHIAPDASQHAHVELIVVS